MNEGTLSYVTSLNIKFKTTKYLINADDRRVFNLVMLHDIEDRSPVNPMSPLKIRQLEHI